MLGALIMIMKRVHTAVQIVGFSDAGRYTFLGGSVALPGDQWYTRISVFRPKRKVFNFRLSVSAAESKG